MENRSPAPVKLAKTDSLADYTLIKKQPSNSEKTLTDSDFAFDFEDISTNSDGTINSEDAILGERQKSLLQEQFSLRSRESKDKLIKEGCKSTSSIPHQPRSEILINPLLISALESEPDSTTLKTKDKEYSYSMITKYFTNWRITWWVVSFVIFFSISPFLGVVVFLLQFLGLQCSPGQTISKRVIKWSVEKFSEQIKTGLLVSPSFLDKSGVWNLVISQKESIDGLQTSFGLIASDLPREVEHVKATLEFSCVNQDGHELCPGFQCLFFQHSFACVGDNGYSRGITLSRRQVKEHKQLSIKCRIEFEITEIGYFNELYKRFMGVYERDPCSQRSPVNSRNTSSLSPVAPTFGNISQQLSNRKDLKEAVWRGSPTTKFISHPETKTFVWEISNFRSLLKNAECWGLFSPQFFVNSHDFCSIWRLKFFELLGVFRLHVQLRGLPGAIKQVKTWHLVTLVDNYGDQIVPDDCNPRLKYPDYLNLWQSHRHILYSRETILDRFVSTKGTVTVRISLQVEPNELIWMEGSGSDGWILA